MLILVCFVVDESGQGFDFAVSLVVLKGLLSIDHLCSCICIVFSSWLLFVSGLGQRFRVTRSWHVMFVHSRRVHIQSYFVCSFVGTVTTCMLNPVWKGGESILWYCLMMLLVIFFHSLPWIALYCLMCLRSSHWNPYMLFDSVISRFRMYS
jgi:hypothetical protein